MKNLSFTIIFVCTAGCTSSDKDNHQSTAPLDSKISITPTKNATGIDTVRRAVPPTAGDNTDVKNVPVDSIINFAKSLIGVPYKYGSVDPAVGFDCSGFITYVYSHFGIQVPRSSIGFTNIGTDVPVEHSQEGDFILFKGTDSSEDFVGHMGIIISHDNAGIRFIHSTSGRAYGVTVTPLGDRYLKRFVKVVRLNDRSKPAL